MALKPDGSGSEASTLFTDDAQTALALLPGSFPNMQGENEIDVSMTPVPTIAPPPPGVTFLGNDYRVTARYHGSGADVPEPFHQDALLELSYPHGNPAAVYRYNSAAWIAITGQVSPAVRKIDIRTRAFGDFIVGERAGATPAPAPAPIVPNTAVVAVVVLAALAAGFALFRRLRPR